jgi:hypothetical protein
VLCECVESKMEQVFSELSSLVDIVNYDIDTRQGNTGYIDFIDSSDFSSLPEGECLIKGVDMHNRPFLSICYDVMRSDKSFRKEVGTIFQRYSDCRTALAYGTPYFPNALWNDSRIRTQSDLNELISNCKKLICGEQVKVSDFHTKDEKSNTLCVLAKRKKMLSHIKDNCTLCDDLCNEVMQYI